MRYVVGAFDTGRGGSARAGGWRPRNSEERNFEGLCRIWTVGHHGADIRSGPALGGSAEVLTAGCCLGTQRELNEARDSAERGRWAHATQLPGSYLAVVRSGSTVRVAGDRAGTIAVHWVVDGDEVLWSTSALVLAAYTGGCIDEVRLLAALCLRGVDHLGPHSYFEGVHRVRPGHALVLEPGAQPRTEHVPRGDDRLTFVEGAEALAEQLSTAVVRRTTLNRSISSDLSGGMDSGTITSLAAAHRPLLAITYTDDHMSEEDDGIYARRVAADFPTTITHAQVNGVTELVQHFDQLDDLSMLPVTDSPSLTLGLLGIKRAHLAPALGYGSGTHLTGRGGDDVLSAVPAMSIDLYRSGRRREALRRLAAFARERRCSVHSVVTAARRTERTTYEQALASLSNHIKGAAPEPQPAPAGSLAWCGTLPSAAWLTGDGGTALALLLAGQAVTSGPEPLPGGLHERLYLERMGEEHGTYDQISRQLWGLPIHAPYLDNAVVDVCHAVPGWERSVPGDFKPLARAALTGTAPAYLLERRTKTSQTGSVYAGLRANATALQHILASSHLAETGLIDAQLARRTLKDAVRGAQAPLGALHALVAAELWLSTTPTSREQWWEQAPIAQRSSV
ncbi:asparagine synthase-related protein [Streptomyces sp. NPDC059564]|uniref:asparagine synthase-related protein n=1 Tax=Streptomyces sp. NPDC059564 TaxID=3346865 RepID=UPI00369B253F